MSDSLVICNPQTSRCKKVRSWYDNSNVIIPAFQTFCAHLHQLRADVCIFSPPADCSACDMLKRIKNLIFFDEQRHCNLGLSMNNFYWTDSKTTMLDKSSEVITSQTVPSCPQFPCPSKLHWKNLKLLTLDSFPEKPSTVQGSCGT